MEDLEDGYRDRFFEKRKGRLILSRKDEKPDLITS